MTSGGSMIEKDVVVIGGGISGLVTAKCLKEDGFDVAILERSCDIGGLWTFRETDYGVMRFTHINVSKYNYAFSDFPFPENVPDYPHHSDMARYIKDYAHNFGIMNLVQFRVRVINVEQIGEKWRVTCCRVGDDGKTNLDPEQKLVYVCSFVAISTGHHAKPTWPSFKGEETFTGDIIHAVDYKDAIYNGCAGKRVLVVGIGNSAVDVAVDCAAAGRCPSVYISTRSGAWVVPNYLFGHATDLYACRMFFWLPRAVGDFVFGKMISIVSGSPWRWGLNPKMKVLQTQPTVSPTLVHYIQRGNVKIAPNITKIEGSTVHFVNGTSADFDKIIYCTGYKIDLPFLPESLKRKFINENSNEIRLYKNVFATEIGHTLAFIGFVQPASGGILSMSEIQGRWFSYLCKGKVRLPSKQEMEAAITHDERENRSRWYKSARHTIQRDPVIYNDEIASFIGAKPDLWSQPSLALRLLIGSCGASQWRLNGPHKWNGAAEQVRKVPVPELWKYSLYALLLILLVIVFYVMRFLSTVLFS